MSLVSKETLLKADDPKNRDAFLYDMLNIIDKKIDVVLQLKIDIAKCEKQLAYIKGVGASISVLFSAALAWLFKTS